MNRQRFFALLAVLLLLFSGASVSASEWILPVGFSYVSGFGEIRDVFIANLEEEGYYVESTDSFPVGIAFQPSYQYDNGFGIGTGLGPLMMIAGNASLISMPVNLDVNYRLFPEANISWYGRIGARYNILAGDYVISSTPGVFAAVGMDFLKLSRIFFRGELAYDTSEIEIENWDKRRDESYQPSAFMFSLYVAF